VARRGAEREEPDQEVRRPEQCSSCSSVDLTALPMVLGDGTPVTFVSCHVCERREWLTAEDDGSWSSIPIESVLARSGKKKP
jgi:hypothetical protein